METVRPTMKQTVDALVAIRDALAEPCAYLHEGRFHFRLDGPWTLAVSADSGERFRVAVCHSGRELTKMWALARDLDRLADLALAAKTEALALSVV